MIRGLSGKGSRALGRTSRIMARVAVEELGLPPSRVGYRWVETWPIRDAVPEEHRTVLHAEQRAVNALPRNATLEELPSNRGWWGFSFRDVPARLSGETLLLRVPDGRVVPCVDSRVNEFHICVLTPEDRALDIREMHFRPEHHPSVLRGMQPRRMEAAVWVLERVYANHSHWLTAHLPKIIMARDGGFLSRTILPGEKTTPTIEQSLRMLGVGQKDAPRLDPIQPLHIRELEVLATDRFRPELLQSVRTAFGDWIAGTRSRRIYISRERATRRRLVNEDQIWSLFRQAGFERVYMEDLAFEDQVTLMGEAEAIAAPHGAGLTNILFSPAGTKVVEIADLSFPNPNVYATASALDQQYWIVPAETRGGGHPLERDMWADPERVREVVRAL